MLADNERVFERIFRWSEKYPEHKALIYGDTPVTYGELYDKSVCFAAQLIKSGVGSGDRVLYAFNVCPEFYYTVLACSMIGAVAVGVNMRSALPEIKHIINQTEPKAAVFDLKLYDSFKSVTDSDIVLIPSDEMELHGTPDRHYLNILDKYRDAVDGETPLLVIYTSGTTSGPKGAVLTNGNLCSGAEYQNKYFNSPAGCGMPDIFQNYVPVNHVSGAVEWGLYPLMAGITELLIPVFNPVTVLEYTQKYRATILGGVPAMWMKMFEVPDFDKYDLSSVKWCLSGAAPLSESLATRIYDICGVCVNPLGMTETSGFCTYFPAGSTLSDAINTVGNVYPELQYKITDESGNRVKPGSAGQLMYKGKPVIKRYYSCDIITDCEGFIHSGDMAFEDERGRLHLCGRKDDMFTVGGYNVFPAEIEAVLQKYKGITGATVMPIPHKTMGNVCRAYISTEAGCEIDYDKLQSYLSDSFIYYKVPRSFVVVNNGDIPATSLGKAKRSWFAEQIKKEFSL